MIIYKLIGFNNYIIKDKVLYRKEFITRDKKYILERKIKKTEKDNKLGYYLVRRGKRKYYELNKLSHRLKKVKEIKEYKPIKCPF
jgi:hypothetical protein